MIVRRVWKWSTMPDPLCKYAVAIFLGTVATFSVPLLRAEREVSTGVVVRPVSRLHPVLGADDKTHLVYELEIINHSSLLISLDRLEALDSAGGSLAQLQGEALWKQILVSGGEKGKIFGPSRSGYIFMDIAIPRSTPLPATIRHLIATTSRRAAESGDGPNAAPDSTRLVGQSTRFLGAEIVVDPAPAIVISAPLRGPNWLIGNGCCYALNGHRIVNFAINGALAVPEKFAIDFVQLGRDYRLFSGPMDKLSSYAYFGVPVYAIADGRVVDVEDGAPDQMPGALPQGMTPATAGGNRVIVDLENGRFALYAHLQPRSIQVKAGDRIRRGDTLGKLGNSGNTTNPHLHLQISDRPSFVAGEALPFVIDDFEIVGALVDIRALFDGKPGTLDKISAGPRQRSLPLDNSVVSFH
jgi:hypothetical protein